MLAPVYHVLPLTTIVRERALPIEGRVTARMNQKVNPNDIIAEARWAREHVLIDVARSLHLSNRAADRLLQCKVGDNLAAGAIVATGSGLFPRTIKASRAGRVVAAGGGEVLLEVGEDRLQLRAGIPGTVIELIRGRGAVIQAAGALIQGVWGNNRIDTGTLISLAERPESALSATQFDGSLRGSVILGGPCKDAESLRAAAELPIRGLILSSLLPSLLPLAREMKYPIIITEGFGRLPMNSAAYRLLSTNVRREVTLNAEAYDRFSGARPEVIIPLPISGQPPLPYDAVEFAAGQQVRVRRPPAAGMIGTLVTLRSGLTALPSGLRARAAEVKLENGESITVPLVNLEVVG